MEKTVKDIKVGDRFGDLVVLAIDNSRAGKTYCYCKSDDGAIGIPALAEKLLNGEPIMMRSLGNAVNPLIKHPLHRVWSDMIMRCENPKRPQYCYYGGRGIRVCDEWRRNYMSFYNWAMTNGYKDDRLPSGRNKWTLDRIDLNGNYCPENCRWVDYRTQNNNRRDKLVVEFNGKTKSIREHLQDYNTTVQFFFVLLRQGHTELEALEIISKL